MPIMSKRLALVMTGVFALSACEVTAPPSVWITVSEDMPLRALADSLATHKVVVSARRFERFARINRRHLGIQPGTYPLRIHSTMGAVLSQLRRGTPPVLRVTVPAGLTLAELATWLAQPTGHSPAAFLAAATDSTLRAVAGTSAGTVEGYLYPTTYRFPTDGSPRYLLGMMIDTFNVRWRTEWDRQLEALALSRQEAVVLASIVQGEGPREEDWNHVAAVYYNRLRAGMRLQADPTVVYALGVRRRLVYQDYQIASPYNTYRISGLPPAPINAPSARAIDAVLHPTPTDDLYLVAAPDGRHVFSETYDEHLHATRRLRDGSAH